ncbi:MAG: carboxypeptidase regulatory-like domain-containing protein [Bryobacterales bacterium]|nr:carboxypeptidase regulatory-like domain-containing protein [Bryobacterales bacterium]
MNRMPKAMAWAGVLLWAAARTTAYGQLLFGSIQGVVTDPSGAAVPTAKVTAVQRSSSQSWESRTNDSGIFVFPTLPPGEYEVRIEAPGFRPVRRLGVQVMANAAVRVDAALEVGQVSETLEVRAETSALQTDAADIRSELPSTSLRSLPVPVTRNYQNLLVTVPGMSPPQSAHSISANPSRALMVNANGTTAQSVAVRVDGATTWNSWLPHVSGYVPALEAIETVSVQRGSFEADLGFAGGAAVNVQIKSGTNEFHGVGFAYHTNQHLMARAYFLPRDRDKNKRILNQVGGTFGGPVIRNRFFFFGSYEGTPERQSSFRLGSVPTLKMRAGDFSDSPRTVYDPMTGQPDGSGRTPFAGNLVPASRQSPIIRKIVDLTPQPNTGTPGGLVNNYYAAGSFAYDRHTVDTKLNGQLTERLSASARISYLDWQFDNPPFFGALGGPGIESRGLYDGKGLGHTLSMTYSGIYTISPTVVLDGYFGYTMIQNGVDAIRLDENLGRDFLGIPGTNGSGRNDGGWPGFNVTGFDAFGRAYQNSPWSLRLPQAQYAASLAVVRGRHNLRAGWDALWVGMDGMEPAGSPGFFNFTREVTGTRGVAVNEYNSYAAFLLGLPNSMQKNVRTEMGTVRTWANSIYFRDKWQLSPALTLTLGLRWDYFGVPTRAGARGLEIYDFQNDLLSLCGVGSLPKNCGFAMSRRYWAPRVGVAWRASGSLVVRAGYGIAWDPINIGRNPLQTYPIVSLAAFPAQNDFQPVAAISQGIPAVSAPDLGNGLIRVPKTVTLELADPRFRRSYIQSWNLIVQKELAGGWIAEAGYVGNRALRLPNRWQANYGTIGLGTAGLVLNQRFGRTASTTLFSDTGGFRSWYDSLQSSLERRFRAGQSVRVTYTWSKALGPRGNEIGVDGYTNNNPAYWPLIRKVPRNYDRTHQMTAALSAPLPFGRGRRWAGAGAAAALLGGWQIQGLLTAYTGPPFSVTSSGASLNAPFNGQIADQVKPEVEIYRRRELWFDTNAYRAVVEPRFGNSGWDQLRGPGLVNVDLGVFRSFRLRERTELQFRAEAFNATNTPHFANPRSDVTSSGFGEITGIQNTGREGIDERLFRFGLRISF